MVDVSRASTARIHNLYQGGTVHYASDRIAAAKITQLASNTQEIIRGGRRFLLRAVRHLARHHHIGQFIDFGCGLPAKGAVHDVAQGARRGARVAYVDHDPIVLARGRLLLEGEHTRVISADLRDGAGAVFARAEQAKEGEEDALLHRQEPTAALLCGVLDELDDAAADRLVGDVKAHLAPGSCLVLSSLASEDPLFRRRATALMLEITAGHWGRLRSPEHIAGFLTGLRRTDPLGDVTAWRSPRDDTVPPTGWIAYGGIARIP